MYPSGGLKLEAISTVACGTRVTLRALVGSRGLWVRPSSMINVHLFILEQVPTWPISKVTQSGLGRWLSW